MQILALSSESERPVTNRNDGGVTSDPVHLCRHHARLELAEVLSAGLSYRFERSFRLARYMLSAAVQGSVVMFIGGKKWI